MSINVDVPASRSGSEDENEFLGRFVEGISKLREAETTMDGIYTEAIERDVSTRKLQALFEKDDPRWAHFTTWGRRIRMASGITR